MVKAWDTRCRHFYAERYDFIKNLVRSYVRQTWQGNQLAQNPIVEPHAATTASLLGRAQHASAFTMVDACG
jgi:hypothetical protein